MDLGTVERQLCTGRYCSAEAFARDTRLVFSNALLFNSDLEDPIHQVVRGEARAPVARKRMSSQSGPHAVPLSDAAGQRQSRPADICLAVQAALRLSRSFESHWATLKLEPEPEAASAAAPPGALAKKKKPLAMFNKVPSSGGPSPESIGPAAGGLQLLRPEFLTSSMRVSRPRCSSRVALLTARPRRSRRLGRWSASTTATASTSCCTTSRTCTGATSRPCAPRASSRRASSEFSAGRRPHPSTRVVFLCLCVCGGFLATSGASVTGGQSPRGAYGTAARRLLVDPAGQPGNWTVAGWVDIRDRVSEV